MLKWSIMKTENGWEEESPNDTIIEQLLHAKQDTGSLLPCLIKIKSLNCSDTSNSISSLSTPNLSAVTFDYDASPTSPTSPTTPNQQPTTTINTPRSTNPQSINNSHSIRNNDIWLILKKYYSNYALVTCTDMTTVSSMKKFAIPFDYDGLFSVVINNKRYVKTYKSIKDMEFDLKKGNKIILSKAVIGFTIVDNNNNNNNNKKSDDHGTTSNNININTITSNVLNNIQNTTNAFTSSLSAKYGKKSSQYKIHKLEEGTYLRFEKFCYIEASKCQKKPTTASHNYNNSTIEENSEHSCCNNTHNDSLFNSKENKVISYGKRSLFSSIFSNFQSQNTTNTNTANSTIRSNCSTIKSDANNYNCFCTNGNCTSGNHDSISIRHNNGTTKRFPNLNEEDIVDNGELSDNCNSIRNNKKDASKIVRVIKCFDAETNATVYIKDTSSGEFMIDASTNQETEESRTNEQVKSNRYLFDINTLLTRKYETNSIDQNIEFELMAKRSTKFQRLPFMRIRLLGKNETPLNINKVIIKNIPTLIIYDVNRNKFLEYFLFDLIPIDNLYKLYKASKTSDLLAKYSAKLEWCLTTLNEFKHDVKLVMSIENQNTNGMPTAYQFGIFLEQYLFRTYSRRNFRRRTVVSSSLPACANKAIKQIMPNDTEEDNVKSELKSASNTSENGKAKATSNMYIQKTNTILQHKKYLKPKSVDESRATSVNSVKESLNDSCNRSQSVQNVPNHNDSFDNSNFEIIRNGSPKKPNKFQRIIKFATTSNRSSKSKQPQPIPEEFLRQTPPELKQQQQKLTGLKTVSTGTIRNKLHSIFASSMNITNNNIDLLPHFNTNVHQTSSVSSFNLPTDSSLMNINPKKYNSSNEVPAADNAFVTVINIKRKVEHENSLESYNEVHEPTGRFILDESYKKSEPDLKDSHQRERDGDVDRFEYDIHYMKRRQTNPSIPPNTIKTYNSYTSTPAIDLSNKQMIKSTSNSLYDNSPTDSPRNDDNSKSESKNLLQTFFNLSKKKSANSVNSVFSKAHKYENKNYEVTAI